MSDELDGTVESGGKIEGSSNESGCVPDNLDGKTNATNPMTKALGMRPIIMEPLVRIVRDDKCAAHARLLALRLLRSYAKRACYV